MYKGEKTILRAYEKKDLEDAHRLFNDLEVQRLLNPGVILPLSLEEEQKFIETNAASKESRYNFAIETHDGVYIGGCGYFDFNRRNGTTYIGIAIAHRDYWGKGFGTDALRVLLRFLFLELNVRKVLLNVFAFNERAVACYRRLGFGEEGRLKQQVYRDGTYHDELIMSLFREQFNV